VFHSRNEKFNQRTKITLIITANC